MPLPGSSEIKTTNVQIIDKAVAPTIPVKPQKKKNILLSMIVGLVFGVGLVFFVEYLDNTIKNPDDVEQYLKSPLLGIVKKLDFSGKVSWESLVVHASSKFDVAEAIRDIRTNLIFSLPGGGKGRILLVSSSVPNEGKSFVSSNIAVSMAQAGEKILLIDADLRKPTLNKYFEIKREPGITNILVAENDQELAIHNSLIPNLWLIPCGPIPPNPSELLGSPKMKEFLKNMRERFDWIILDSPPESSVTDANVLNSMVDGTILIVRAGGTSKELIRQSISQFNEIQPKVLGVILNMVDFTK